MVRERGGEDMNLEQKQCLLGALGYYGLRRRDGSLCIDGQPGPATRKAVKDFQRAQGLQQDGLWGPLTEAAIRRVIGAGEDRKTQTQEKPPYRWIREEDFRCRCGGQFCNGWPASPHRETLRLLEQIGEHFGRRIRPHSGLRCRTWNARWGGASQSQHLIGGAMDFHIDGISHREVYDYADSLLGNRGGLGLYSWGIHLDDRARKARWRG